MGCKIVVLGTAQPVSQGILEAGEKAGLAGRAGRSWPVLGFGKLRKQATNPQGS